MQKSVLRNLADWVLRVSKHNAPGMFVTLPASCEPSAQAHTDLAFVVHEFSNYPREVAE